MKAPGGVAQTITCRRLVDLSRSTDPHILIWPGDLPVIFEMVADLTDNRHRLRRFSTGDHSATQIIFRSPAHGADKVRFLLDESQAAGVRIDARGVHPDEAYEIHRQMLAQGCIVLETLADLDRSPSTGATLVTGISRLRDGIGSPAWC